jgi:hypothetical protein
MMQVVYLGATQRGMPSALEPLAAAVSGGAMAFGSVDSLVRQHPPPRLKELKAELRQTLLLTPVLECHSGHARREVKITALHERLFLASEEKRNAERESKDHEDGLHDFIALLEKALNN